MQVTLVILYNLNLPPDERYKTKNILTNFILPGSNTAKDLNSFLQPLIDELLKLEYSIQAFNSYNNTIFQMRAQVTLVTGRRCTPNKLNS